jgi:hypothetical protein
MMGMIVKHILIAFSLCAMIAVTFSSAGCDATGDAPTASAVGTMSMVDKDSLESVLAANSLALIDFSATW